MPGMKRPSFQFYPADWLTNPKLRRCSEAARGAFMDVMCVLHDSDEYGVVRWPLVELARAAGVRLKLAKELAAKDALKGADSGAKPYVHTPRHAGRDGEPVVLVQVDDGPVWYCSRMVRDEWIRERRGAGTRFDSENQPSRLPTRSPTRRVGEPQGDGASSSSSSSSHSVGERELKYSREHDRTSQARAEGAEGHSVERIAQMLQEMGITDASICSQELRKLIADGVTIDECRSAANKAIAKDKPRLDYVLGTIIGRRSDAARAPALLAKQETTTSARRYPTAEETKRMLTEGHRNNARGGAQNAEARTMSMLAKKFGEVSRSDSTSEETDSRNQQTYHQQTAVCDEARVAEQPVEPMESAA
jgi:hypothetical protein